ncbi:autoinducer binding domain-containing protein [Stutzerimonas nitrititolerans]|uniref:autoinducer binding domain-containing protein n=1 Tax=Stutzerimonas nitrititolerans TaxID=2482751 RepID=UPI003D8186B9
MRTVRRRRRGSRSTAARTHAAVPEQVHWRPPRALKHPFAAASILDHVLGARLVRLWFGFGLSLARDRLRRRSTELTARIDSPYWQRADRTHRYQCIDPFLRHARCSSMPFLWLDVSTRASSCRAMRRSWHAPGVMASLLPAAPGSRYTCEASSSLCATSARLSGMVGGRNICLRMRRCCQALPRRCTWVTSTHCRHSSMLLGFSNSRSQCGKCFIVCSDVIVR